MNWDNIERWAEKNTRYVGFFVVLIVGVLGIVHAAAI